MYEESDFYTDLIVCDSNCESLILDIAEKKDIFCCLSGYDISFDNLGDADHPTPIKCENDGSLIKDHMGFIKKMLSYAGNGISAKDNINEDPKEDRSYERQTNDNSFL